MREITIDPITRLEGHGKVTIQLDERGQVADARFHVLQFRGFEVFIQGRPLEEMPVITQRICGICPVSHQLAAAKACDAVWGVAIPPTARHLRELLHMGQYIQSHALHFFYLASPDLLLGWDADPAIRNVAGVAAQFPEVARQGIRLRQFGQEIIAALGGKRVHPAFAVPGGVSDPLDPASRDQLLARFPEALASARVALSLWKGWLGDHLAEVHGFANFSSLYAGLVDDQGNLALYDGRLRVVDPWGESLVECDPSTYLDHLAEAVEPWSYLKFPYYRSLGYPQGLYRVGPLARLRVANGIDTPQAAAEYQEFRALAQDGLAGATQLYHHARLVELVHALERAQELLEQPEICDRELRASGQRRHAQGVGVIEAPRGTLIHHYWVDENGGMEKANLIVATGHNNLAMNRSVALVARDYITDGQPREGILNRIEGAIRCYDPCLSCSSHALGQMPLRVQVRDHRGQVCHELGRD